MPKFWDFLRGAQERLALRAPVRATFCDTCAAVCTEACQRASALARQDSLLLTAGIVRR